MYGGEIQKDIGDQSLQSRDRLPDGFGPIPPRWDRRDVHHALPNPRVPPGGAILRMGCTPPGRPGLTTTGRRAFFPGLYSTRPRRRDGRSNVRDMVAGGLYCHLGKGHLPYLLCEYNPILTFRMCSLKCRKYDKINKSLQFSLD